MQVKKVCVYCASSNQMDNTYLEAAGRLGMILAENSITVVCGGGAVGSMGYLADGALSRGGKVIGIIPQFMVDLEWAHNSLTELRIVETMSERKQQMIAGTDAIIALPGGSGTLEELIETITLKRLGLYYKPVVLINTRNYFDPLLKFLESAISEKFMNQEHRDMWSVIESEDDIISTIKNAPQWSPEARSFAVVR